MANAIAESWKKNSRSHNNLRNENPGDPTRMSSKMVPAINATIARIIFRSLEAMTHPNLTLGSTQA